MFICDVKFQTIILVCGNEKGLLLGQLILLQQYSDMMLIINRSNWKILQGNEEINKFWY